MILSKKEMTEEDIKLNFITPANVDENELRILSTEKFEKLQREKQEFSNLLREGLLRDSLQRNSFVR